jgi:hypothetical protein
MNARNVVTIRQKRNGAANLLNLKSRPEFDINHFQFPG